MALIGNSMKLGAGPLFMQGASAYTVSPNTWYSPGARKRFAYGQGAIAGVTDRAAVPEGYTPPYAREPAQKSGGLASRNRILGSGEVTTANLAGGLNAIAALAGHGDIDKAELELVIFAFANLSASGVLTADIVGKIEALASLVGNGTITLATLELVIFAFANLSASGTLSASIAGTLAAVANLTGSGTITAATLQATINALADLVGSGVLSASILGTLQAAAALVGAGNLTAATEAIANMTVSLLGSSTTSAVPFATGELSANITVVGGTLTTANVADAVWGAISETGFTFEQVMRLLAAVAAGKTTIQDLGGGNAIVTFRDLNDTKDRIVADMTGSERIDVTKDVT